MLDERLLRVTIDLDGKSKHVFETLAINAIGMKHASAIQNNAEIRIANIAQVERDQLLTDGTPFTVLKPKNSILIEAGRKSTKLSQVYIGDITLVSITEAPDIWLTIRALTGQKRKQELVAIKRDEKTNFSALAKQTADLMGLRLDFEAPDRPVSNFTFSSVVGKLVNSLNEITHGVHAFVDDGTLLVRSRKNPHANKTIPINIRTGLIGIPKFVDFGVACTVLMDQRIELADNIELTSKSYPAVDGVYNIHKLGFNLANRDTPFYYNIEASRS